MSISITLTSIQLCLRAGFIYKCLNYTLQMFLTLIESSMNINDSKQINTHTYIRTTHASAVGCNFII